MIDQLSAARLHDEDCRILIEAVGRYLKVIERDRGGATGPEHAFWRVVIDTLHHADVPLTWKQAHCLRVCVLPEILCRAGEMDLQADLKLRDLGRRLHLIENLGFEDGYRDFSDTEAPASNLDARKAYYWRLRGGDREYPVLRPSGQQPDPQRLWLPGDDRSSG